MKPISELLTHLHSLDVKLWADGTSLRYDAPQETLTADLLDQMRERKAEILAFLQNELAVTHSDSVSILPVSRDKEFPLSFAQQRLWFLEQMEPGQPTYCIAAAYRLSGSPNVPALEQSLKTLIQRHEILRTTFPSTNGQPVQAISPEAFALTVINLQERPPNQRETEASAHLNQEAQRPFDLEHGPLFRAQLLTLAEQEYILLLTMHHIISDGWSFDVSFRELAALYIAFINHQPSPLSKLPIQYADFSVWQRGWFQGHILQSQLNYWKQQLSNPLPVLQLPTDYPRPPVKTCQGDCYSLKLSKDLTQALKALSQQQGATLFMTLLASFQILLFRYSGQTDMIVGTPIAGRNQPEIERLVGSFANTLALRTDLSGDPSFHELLERVRKTALDAYTHQDLPFEKLLEELQLERDPSYTPLFQVMFVFQKASQQVWQLPELTLTPLEVHTRTAKFYLTLELQETPEGIQGQFEYSSDLFQPATIARIAAHFQTLLEGIIANPNHSILKLPLLTKDEQYQLLVEWNQTQREYPRNTSIHQLFEAQVENTPDAIAIASDQEQLTYQELNERANQLAHYLREFGVGPEVLVGICVERSPLMIVALLGILKAGGAYVPIDPSYPTERLTFMLEDTQIPVLLTQKSLIEKLPFSQACTICLDTEAAIHHQDRGNCRCEVSAENLAYLTYTSGSTGKPKGVCITHRGVVRLVKGVDYANLDSNETFLQLAPISFDASTFEIWGSLLNGARLAIFPPHTPSLEELGQAIKRYQVTTLWLTAGLFHLMVDERLDDLKSLRQLLAGGDVLSLPHVQKFLQQVEGCQLINGYGPTENTTFTCCYRIPKSGELGSSVSIGRAIANTQIYILDPHLQPVPIGVPGELYIAGDGLAQGYWNQPELTEEKFIISPFGNSEGDFRWKNLSQRLYKTGDLARYLFNGNIEFLGRIDNQVKIRGFRIELEEIETTLSQYPFVTQSIVAYKKDAFGDKQLVAYIVLNSASQDFNSAQASNQLRNFLKQKLPHYMIPSTICVLESLPLTPNGKIDRGLLPILNHSHLNVEETIVDSEDELERQLTKIWEELLGIQPIELRDNFFDIGGNSLLAVRLFAEIEKIFGKNLPLSTLFQSATIQDLANTIRQENWLDPWSSIVTMQAGDPSLPPLFYLHAGGANLLVYRDLALRMGPNQPVYGLQPRGLDGKYTPDTHIEDMASHYLALIRERQPNGPYFLAGLSTGGLVALEIAQQLHQQGQEVALLALLDSYGPQYPQLLPPLRRFLSVLWWVILDVGIWRYLFNLGRTEIQSTWTNIKIYVLRNLKSFVVSILSPQQIISLKKLHKSNLSQSSLTENQILQNTTNMNSSTKQQNKNQVIEDQLLHELYVKRQNQAASYIYHYHSSHLSKIEKCLNPWTIFLLKRSTKSYYGNIFLRTLASTVLPLPEALQKVQEANLQAVDDYMPQIYLGKVVLFRAKQQPPGIYHDPYLGWSKIFTNGIEVHEIPGTHHTIIESPLLAQKLKEYIKLQSE